MGYSKGDILTDITEFTDDELIVLVDAIRLRRNRIATSIDKAKKSTDKARQEKTHERLLKKYDQFVKKLNTVDTKITEIEEKLAEILAIRLQLGEDITQDAERPSERDSPPES